MKAKLRLTLRCSCPQECEFLVWQQSLALGETEICYAAPETRMDCFFIGACVEVAGWVCTVTVTRADSRGSVFATVTA